MSEDTPKMRLPKNYARRIWRAIMEFGMLSAGDRVLVGLSGGKDSSLLLYALAHLRQQTGYPFEVAAATIDPGFAPQSFEAELRTLCDTLDVPFFYERHEELAEVIFDPQSDQSPCARCAFFRRGMLNRIASDKGYNKLALGHHLDDAVETFLMNILYSGRMMTLMPVTPQDRSQTTVIRPLCLLREKEITGSRSFFPWQPLSSCCPREDVSQRAQVKALIRNLGADSPQLFDRLVHAMRRAPSEVELWPPQASAADMRQHYLAMIQVLPQRISQGGDDNEPSSGP